MAHYLNIHNKVVEVVPNDVLAAIQQKEYSPWASKDIEELVLKDTSISYCTYADFFMEIFHV